MSGIGPLIDLLYDDWFIACEEMDELQPLLRPLGARFRPAWRMWHKPGWAEGGEPP